MSIAFFIVTTIGLSVLLFIIISKALKGKVKKYSREEIEKEQFGNNN